MCMANLRDEPLITRVPPRKIERPGFTPFNLPDRYKPKQIDLEPKNIPIAETAMTFWERTKFYANLTVLAIRLIPILITLKMSTMKKDWKTTVTGIVKAVFLALSIFGVSTGNVTESLVLGVGYAIVDLVQSFFTADSVKNEQ